MMFLSKHGAKGVLFLAALTVLGGCGRLRLSEVPATAGIAQNYSLTYDRGTQKLLVSARFKSGANQLELDGKGRITFDGEVLEKNASITDGIEYRFTQKDVGIVDAKRTHVFEFTNNKGERFRNEVLLPAAPAGNFHDTRVNYKQDISVDWFTFDAIQHGRIFLKAMRSEKNEGLLEPLYRGAVEFAGDGQQEGQQRGMLTLKSEKLAGAGKYLGQICHERVSPLQKGDSAGGEAKTIYCSEYTDFEIVK